METESKPWITKGTKITCAVRAGVFQQRVVGEDARPDSYPGAARYFYATNSAGGDQTGLKAVDENKTWVRGWTGKVVTTFKRTIIAEERKRKLAKAKVERVQDKEHAAKMVKVFVRAAAVVKRAKLPRELRAAAFTVALTPYPWRPFGP
jgi:hypothetical protein